MRAQVGLPILIVLLLAVMSVWLADFLSLPDAGPATPDPAHPDYILDAFTSERYGADGQLAYVLRGDQLRHYAANNTTLVKIPRLTLWRGALPPWEADAEQSRVDHGEGRIDLLGHVVMRRAGQPALQLVTRDVSLWPERDYAQTAAPVQMLRGHDRIDAVGMHAWLAEGRVKLLEDVIGRYATE